MLVRRVESRGRDGMVSNRTEAVVEDKDGSLGSLASHRQLCLMRAEYGVGFVGSISVGMGIGSTRRIAWMFQTSKVVGSSESWN